MRGKQLVYQPAKTLLWEMARKQCSSSAHLTQEEGWTGSPFKPPSPRIHGSLTYREWVWLLPMTYRTSESIWRVGTELELSRMYTHWIMCSRGCKLVSPSPGQYGNEQNGKERGYRELVNTSLICGGYRPSSSRLLQCTHADRRLPTACLMKKPRNTDISEFSWFLNVGS